MTQTITVTALAAMLRLSVRRVHELVAEGVIPRIGRGRYDPTAAVGAYVDYLRHRHAIELGRRAPDFGAILLAGLDQLNLRTTT